MEAEQKTEEGRRSIGARRNPESAEAILEAAEAILAEGGAAGFSIEAVARRARAGKPTIYRWWPSRTALLLDVYERHKGSIGTPDTGNLNEDVFEFLKGLLAAWRGPAGAVFRSVLAEAQSNADAAEALAAFAAERRRGSTGAIFRRAQARGEARADLDPEIAAEMLVGYAWSRVLTGRLGEDDASLRQVVRIFVEGVRG
jgi:AcrR family transcriptional regulator